MLRDHEMFRMIYILVISTLGDLTSQTFLVGVLGYRNEENGTRVPATN